MSCSSCEVVAINGVRCHEIGCPEAWRDYTTECFECGFDFQPEYKYQNMCNECLEPREDED